MPAYFIKDGIIHYGYQLVSRNRVYVKLCLTLISVPLKEHYGWLKAYEPVRFVLFSNSGLLNPISHFNIVIRYHRNRVRKVLGGIQLRKLSRSLHPLSPIPYHQSPSPHPYFLDFVDPKIAAQGSSKATPPIITSTGNLETILVASFLPTVNVSRSWHSLRFIQPDRLPNFSESTLLEITQESAPYSIHSRKLRELFNLPTFQPTHYDQSTQTLQIDPPIPLNLTYMYCQTDEKQDQGTQTEGMVVFAINAKLEVINTPRVQTEMIFDTIEQVNLINFN